MRVLNTYAWIALPSLLIAISCARPPVDEEIVARKRIAGSNLDVVIVARDAGATSSTAYHFYIVPPEESYKSHESSLTVDKLYSLKSVEFKARSKDTIEIKLPSCRVFKSSKHVQIGSRSITIEIKN